MLTLLPLPAQIDQSAVENLLNCEPLTALAERWNSPSPNSATPCRAGVALSETHLGFVAAFSLPPEQTHAEVNSCIAGLWKFTVAELFIGSDDSNYLELHLAPWGNWWAEVFSDYRTPTGLLTSTLEAIFAQRHTKTDWRAAMIVPRRSVALLTGPTTSLKANLCSIVVAEGTIRYFSAATPRTASPDFHAAELRQPLLMPDAGYSPRK